MMVSSFTCAHESSDIKVKRLARGVQTYRNVYPAACFMVGPTVVPTSVYTVIAVHQHLGFRPDLSNLHEN